LKQFSFLKLTYFRFCLITCSPQLSDQANRTHAGPSSCCEYLESVFNRYYVDAASKIHMCMTHVYNTFVRLNMCRAHMRDAV